MWLLTQSFKASRDAIHTPEHSPTHSQGRIWNPPAASHQQRTRRHTQQNSSTYRGHPVPMGHGRGADTPSTPIHTTETPTNSLVAAGLRPARRRAPALPRFQMLRYDHLQFVPDVTDRARNPNQ